MAAFSDAGGMIALIAHDGTKEEMLALAAEFRDQLEEEAVVATATTGGVLRCELELDVRCVRGPRGRSAATSRSARWSRPDRQARGLPARPAHRELARPRHPRR
jgi:hypothetical protein